MAAVTMRFAAQSWTAASAGADQAEDTDLASLITFANELRPALVEKGLIKGGA
ncbi:MAG: hypothetical protein IT580_23245 [Verrucomicrobiales bacterium]|nr:hypothetical protein [Verrucomicrobiales bacterium]